MSARSLERVKHPQDVIIPTTNRGQFAGFQQENPVLMASAFGVEVPEYNPTDFQGLTFLANTFQWLLTNDVITAKIATAFEERLNRVGVQTQNVKASTLLAETFGEVKPENRGSLGLVAVFNGLQHNILEAIQRQTQEIYKLSYLIGAVQSAISKASQEIEERRAFLNKQRTVDLKAKQDFALNTASGYMKNTHIGETATDFAQNLVQEDDQELKELKSQQQMLQGLLFWLNSYLWL